MVLTVIVVSQYSNLSKVVLFPRFRFLTANNQIKWPSQLYHVDLTVQNFVHTLVRRKKVAFYPPLVWLCPSRCLLPARVETLLRVCRSVWVSFAHVYKNISEYLCIYLKRIFMTAVSDNTDLILFFSSYIPDLSACLKCGKESHQRLSSTSG